MEPIVLEPGGNSPEGRIPPLENGDLLTRAEFERRYEAMPHLKRAELLRGVVYMGSPVRAWSHGGPHADVLLWLGVYRAATPGTRVFDNTSLRLGPETEPQPDAVLMRLPEHGGRARIDEGDYLAGAPELVVEIAASTVSYDSHLKRELYQEHGVAEYLLWRVQDGALDWYCLESSDGAPRYARLQPDAEGILRSRIFPGLWLHSEALLRGDMAQVLVTAQKGIASRGSASPGEPDARETHHDR